MTPARRSKSGSKPAPRASQAPDSASASGSDGVVAVGRVVSVRGVRGELVVEPLTDFADRFAAGSRLWLQGRPLEVERSSTRRGRVLLTLRGVENRDQAASLRGVLLEVPESELRELEPGTYYRFQLIGLAVFDPAGGRLGTLADILATGANDVYVVRDDGREVLVPALDDVVLEVDVAGGRMVVDLPPTE